MLQLVREASGVGGRAKVDPAKVLKVAKAASVQSGSDGSQVRTMATINDVMRPQGYVLLYQYHVILQYLVVPCHTTVLSSTTQYYST